MNPNDLRKLTDEMLIIKRQELEMEMMGSYGKTKPTIKPEQRKARRRVIAQINTILKERENAKHIG